MFPNVRAIWENHHLLLMPSRVEGTPLALVEAMLCGRAALVTEIAGHLEWIDEGQTGFVAEGRARLRCAARWNGRGRRARIGEKWDSAAHHAALGKYDPTAGKTMLGIVKSAANRSKWGQIMRHEKVCAVVVTFNRRELLGDCLRALQAQLRPLDGILVVDNATTDGTMEMLAANFPGVEAFGLSENTGGAGGFHQGMKRAYAQGYDWLWVMDDDGIPNPDCLQLMLDKAEPNSVVLPVQQGKHGLHGILGWRNGTYVDLDVRTQKPLTATKSQAQTAFAFHFRRAVDFARRSQTRRVAEPRIFHLVR